MKTIDKVRIGENNTFTGTEKAKEEDKITEKMIFMGDKIRERKKLLIWMPAKQSLRISKSFQKASPIFMKNSHRAIFL